MLKSEALNYFKGNGAELGRKLGIGRAAVQKWGDLIPPLYAVKLEELTHGALKFNAALYPPGWPHHNRRSA